ncbi:GMP/IMP nucleotidase [Nitrincola sp. MINF-07-Sa-05]|uniref:GMP/IMP nucleotidase n=1 Tax=Nitrincola salilacus TaxID=3400273 RepID=UPI003917CCB5
MLDWQAIDTVLLDMDGTLLDLHFDSHFWLEFLPLRYAEFHQMDIEQARAWLHERIVREQGTLNWYCLDYWTRELQLPVTELKREVADRIAFRPYVKAFLQALKDQQLRSVIVTNAHQGSLTLKVEQTRLDQLVDRVICSHDLKAAKEEQLFWQRLQALEPFDPERTLLVDDSLAVLGSAREYGIRHLLSIRQPDSKGPRRTITEFMAIDHFDEVMPTR